MTALTVFHGSNQAMPQPEIRKRRYTKDFGEGFYCTILREQAVRWAQRFPQAIVSRYSYRQDHQLKVLNFQEMSEAWLDFIVACRSGQPHDYDIVIGVMADDQIYNFITDLQSGAISRAAFWELVKFRYPTHQIAFCTERALRQLHFEGAEAVSEEVLS